MPQTGLLALALPNGVSYFLVAIKVTISQNCLKVLFVLGQLLKVSTLIELDSSQFLSFLLVLSPFADTGL